MVETKDNGDKRQLRRRKPKKTVNVYDRKSKTFLGQLVDVHTEGMLVMGNYAFTEDKVYEIDLHCTEDDDVAEFIELTVDCLWTRDEDADRAYWAGCKFIDISPTALQAVQKLMG
jgi:hypothetical protein